ncbi:MAG: hypothetical protein V3U80_10200 [Flavobacteriaceae bacterium]
MTTDKLKDIWKSQKLSKIQFSETDIYKMIHTKSASIVKWIFYISIIEFVIFILPTLFLDTSDVESEIGIESFTKILNIINFCIIMPTFIYLFYKNYKAICVNDSSKKLMKDIIRTKKIVSYYVFSQLTIAAILIFKIAYKISLSDNFLEQIPSDFNMNLFWVIAVVFTLFFIFIVWLFYRLLYGILLSKLNVNYNELNAKDV